MAKETHKIDAADRSLGRLASEIATLLQGKNRVDFKRNQVADVFVVVENAEKLDISQDRLEEKIYDRHSNYPGGRKLKTAHEVVEQKGFAELLRRAVYGMLPNNKLREKMMKRLKIHESSA